MPRYYIPIVYVQLYINLSMSLMSGITGNCGINAIPNMIAILAIAFLLVSSAVQGSNAECSEIQQAILDILKHDMEDKCPLEFPDFDSPIEFEHVKEGEKNTENSFGAVQFSEDLPGISVDGKTFKLFTFSVLPIDLSKGMASLVVAFAPDGYKVAFPRVGVFIPLSLTDTKDDPDLSEPLNSDLASLSKLPQDDTYKINSVQWLKPLLAGVSKITNREYRARYAYMTDCVKVSKDSVEVFFKPLEERPVFPTNTVVVIEPTNFDATVRVERPEDPKQKNTFLVKKTGNEIPKVTVEGNNYEMYSFRVPPFDNEGVGNLAVTFSPEGSESPEYGVTILVPVLAMDEFLPEINENLNEDLNALGDLAPNGQFNMRVIWLKDNLKEATRMTGTARRKYYTVEPETIFKESLLLFK